jgi:hypothetical protein
MLREQNRKILRIAQCIKQNGASKTSQKDTNRGRKAGTQHLSDISVPVVSPTELRSHVRLQRLDQYLPAHSHQILVDLEGDLVD